MTIKCQKVGHFAAASRGSLHRHHSSGATSNPKNMRQLRSNTAAKCKTNLTSSGAKAEMSTSSRGSPPKQPRNSSSSSFEHNSVHFLKIYSFWVQFQNSQLLNVVIDKIHIFKILFFAKFTFLESHI